ncbi:MAG: nucleotide sugar dehydrogenase [Candidatus Aenigmarchaeota archaeon]|nr:nucleotide sugar dehydrogenase [Candidatus Aenigmarchaeota archaeon]
MKTIIVIGVGYVGLPLAIHMAKHFKVIAFDVREDRIEQLKNKFDANNEITKAKFEEVENNIEYTLDEKKVSEGDIIIISVPTPVKKDKTPDLTYLEGASRVAGRNMKKGAIVVYESTTYPGCTEDFCLPVLKSESKLKYKEDFFIGYSPERVNPGDKEHSINNITKIVSGDTKQTIEELEKVYSKVTKVHTTSSIKIAESAKVIENIQRDINIALFNEFAMLFDKMDLDTKEIFEAAGTKWNFMKYKCGFVGGHCIPVDPYYLAQKAQEVGYNPKLILAGRQTNEELPIFVAKKIKTLLEKQNKNPGVVKLLILGATYKENVPDLRDSKVENMIVSLKDSGIKDIHIWEPLIVENKTIFDVENREPKGKYDVVVYAVNHKEFKNIDVCGLIDKKSILIDLKRIFDEKKRELENNGCIWYGL